MFDIGATELLLIIIVAVIVIGPKDMPMALRTAGRWIGKMRRVSGHLRSGLDAMVREAELEDMQKEWDKRNADIMAKHPSADPETGQLEHAGAEMTEKPKAAERPEPAAQNEPPVKPGADAPKAKPDAQGETLPLFGDDAAPQKAKAEKAKD